jgi:hypothetical protein
MIDRIECRVYTHTVSMQNPSTQNPSTNRKAVGCELTARAAPWDVTVQYLASRDLSRSDYELYRRLRHSALKVTYYFRNLYTK